MCPPRPFRPLLFSFVIPHSGTRLSYGTQRHQGDCSMGPTCPTSYFASQLHALLHKHSVGLPAHLPPAPPSPSRPHPTLQKCCQRCEHSLILSLPVPIHLQVPWGWRLKCRQALTGLLLLLSLAEMVVSLPFLQPPSDPQPLSVPIGPAVQALGFLASLLLSIAGRSRGQVGG